MSWRSFPPVATLIVALAIATMIALGCWQLSRADEKEALLASYNAIPEDAPAVDYPADDQGLESALYRRSSVTCGKPVSGRSIAGTNAVGVKGWAHIARCPIASGQEVDVALGWSRIPQAPQWGGGEVAGTIAPGGKLVANPPLADLGPLAKPDPADLPNNHLSYAVQWFLFALTALVIFVLAVWRKARES